MLARRKSTSVAEGSARKVPHCRTCGERMKHHNKDLCNLRSPSEESGAPSTLGSIFEDTLTTSLPSTPPLTPTSTLKSIGGSQLTHVPPYPNKPISDEPSWEVPPESTFYHRRNPYIAPLTLSQVSRNTPLQRTASWISTEKADSEIGNLDDDDYFSSTVNSVSTNSSGTRPRDNVTVAGHVGASSGLLTPPTSPANSQDTNTVTRDAVQAGRQVDVIDAAGNKVIGLDISTLNDNVKSIIRQADSAGYYATIVRPRVGYNRGSVDIRTNEDADKHTTIFVSTAPDTMSINMMCSEAVRRAKFVTEGTPYLNTKSWLSLFLTMFFASLVSIWASLFVIRTFL